MFENVLNYMLLLIMAVLTGLLMELWLKGKRPTLLKFLFLCGLVYFAEAVITIILLAILLHVFPQQESWGNLLRIVGNSQWLDFVISFVATIIISCLLCREKEEKKPKKRTILILIFCSAVLSSIVYFFNSFKLIEYPEYSMPVESVSSIVNSRFSIYPFVLSEERLKEIGDGKKLISEKGNDSTERADVQGEYEEYKEPTTFSEYISAIIDETFAPGMDEEDYLRKAYALFVAGKHDNAFFYIGVMWHYIYNNIDIFGDEWNVTETECLYNAIEAYQEEERIHGGSAALYRNMSLIYSRLGDRTSAREYINKAIENSENKSRNLSTYIGWIYWWSSFEDHTLLRQDAENVLKYEENLSMYVLYGAAAIADNKEVERAYELLCKADEYYQGKSALIKILRCISADLLGIDETFLLQEIYDLEDAGSLTDVEEIYLIRYLFNMNKYKELRGYIYDVGIEEDEELDVEKATIKAICYSKDKDKDQDDIENVRSLQKQVDEALDKAEEEETQSEEKTLLLLSQVLLYSYLGEEDSLELDTQKYDPDENSDIQNAICATAAFNKQEDLDAIKFCDAFFEAEREYKQTISNEAEDSVETNIGEIFSLQNLTSQEETELSYHIHLIYATSHYRYAKENMRKNSKEWKEYMEIAEKECIAFEHTTKSLFEIGEQFEELQKNIDIANGKISDEKKKPISIF